MANKKIEDLEAIKAKVAKIEEKREKEIREYQDKYRAADAAEAEAMNRATKAEKEANVEEYHKAQEAFKLNCDAKKLYGGKLSSLENEPQITKEEFEELREGIASYLAAEVEADKADLKEMVASMLEIKDRESKLLEEGNKLIEHLQKDLLLDPCGIFAASGTFIPQDSKVRRFKDYSVAEFLNFVTSHNLVADLVPKEKPTIWGKR